MLKKLKQLICDHIWELEKIMRINDENIAIQFCPKCKTQRGI